MMRTASRVLSTRHIGRLTLTASVLVAALALALLPGAALAAESAEHSFEAANRSLGLDSDWQFAFWASIFGVALLFGVGAVGYLYRRERGLDWEFQKPDAPHDDHH